VEVLSFFPNPIDVLILYGGWRSGVEAIALINAMVRVIPTYVRREKFLNKYFLLVAEPDNKVWNDHQNKLKYMSHIVYNTFKL